MTDYEFIKAYREEQRLKKEAEARKNKTKVFLYVAVLIVSAFILGALDGLIM